jgi:superfamily II DNA or RNA helicase
MPAVFFDLRPHPFQERILEALLRERSIHNRWRNLVIAATGTGKTVIAAFDFKRFYHERGRQARLLFVAHRQEILQQARATFCNVLRDQNFGELQVGQYQASRMEHLFCSVGMLAHRRLWEQLQSDFYDYIVVDEVHHGAADSYRPIFDHFSPKVLLGLTATPERMDGQNVAADFHNRFAAEIRLPEALEEKLLCPFHYFGIADPVAIDTDQFWRNGGYDTAALEKVYTGAHMLAQQRVTAIIEALQAYEPDLSSVKGVGFCVTINHALFMAEIFNKRGIASAAFVSGVDSAECQRLLADLDAGRITFLFTVDKLSEGIDVPSINVVLFLRPTESMTVFLQQLGRGLRHAPEKECLTVLDFVGQAHRRYRIDTKLKALMPRHRFSIDKEVELQFPHLPPGCSIQFDRLSRQYVLQNIKENLRNLAVQVPERIRTFSMETGKELTFENFVRHHEYEPEVLLLKETWSGWKAKAQIGVIPSDPDLKLLAKSLVRACMVNGRGEATLLLHVVEKLRLGAIDSAVELAGDNAMRLHYRFWGDAGKNVGVASVKEGFQRLSQNPSVLADLEEVIKWSLEESDVLAVTPQLPFSCPFELHAMYASTDILAGLGQATMDTSGQRGVGVLHFASIKAYVLLVTFQKTERDFSPSTMYADYPVSRELLHWESQSNTAQRSQTGQNLIHHVERGYTILVFAREKKKRNGVTLPFTYLGPVTYVSHESERPIKMVWRLRYAMPVTMFEENRRGG